jgi:hypothetical protein
MVLQDLQDERDKKRREKEFFDAVLKPPKPSPEEKLKQEAMENALFDPNNDPFVRAIQSGAHFQRDSNGNDVLVDRNGNPVKLR